jgi:hypothetical protein
VAGLKWRDRHWDARLAHDAVQRAIQRGDLVPEPCADCGEPVSVAHHDSYAERLVVRWLCDSHHRLWHITHPVDYEVLAPPRRARTVTERHPARGKVFRRYLVPRALALRRHGASYPTIAEMLNVSVSTAYTWCKEHAHD